MRALVDRIDWQLPWLEPYRGVAGRLRAVRGATSVATLLNEALAGLPPVELPGGPLHFVAQHALPRGEAYEAFIARSAGVPTRDNLHDLFNGLVWLRFPAWKRRLNALQADRIAHDGVADTRGALRDALTLFDENGALWQAPEPLVDALRRRDWTALFVTHRASWHEARLTLFGHALLEKLVAPRKAITAHLWRLPVGIDRDGGPDATDSPAAPRAAGAGRAGVVGRQRSRRLLRRPRRVSAGPGIIAP
jgi:hypothetical protein